jgi:hypothetical protein
MAVPVALFAEGQQGRGSPFSESIFSDLNGLRRPVKLCYFSCKFKWLSYKQQAMPARVATLSQHLFCELRRRSLINSVNSW